MEKMQEDCCAACGSCRDVAPGVYYYGKQLSVEERMEGSCCRTKQITTAFEIQGRGEEPVCGACVLRRRLLWLAALLPALGFAAFALVRPGLVPDSGPWRPVFFMSMALTLIPAWMGVRRAVQRAADLRDEVAASRARRAMRGKVRYERVNRGEIKGGLGGAEKWSGSTTMRNYTFFTRGKYRRMGGSDRGPQAG